MKKTNKLKAAAAVAAASLLALTGCVAGESAPAAEENTEEAQA